MRNPVPLPDRTMSALSVIEAHWRAICGPRVMPSRGEVVASEIEAALPYLFIVEPVAPSVLRIRHAGRRFVEMTGMEPRGMPLCAFFSPEGRAVLRPILGAMQARPARLRMGLVAGRGIVAPRVAARMLMLPLSDNGLRPDRFLGALVSDTCGERRPLRFDMDGGPVEFEQLRPAGFVPRVVASGGRRHARGDFARPELRLVVAG